MTENQEKQIMNLLNKCVNGIQNLQTDVSEIKSDISELKGGQKRIEKEMRINNRAVNTIAGEQVRMNERLVDLEKASV
jgi:chromosome segregation ATPase